MSNSPETLAKIQSILERDGRFRPEAYIFTLEALSFTIDRQAKGGERRHINGRELLLGIRDYGRKLFGYLGASVFAAWGLRETGDFGDIVFNLVETGLLSKQDTDTKEDFVGVYSFEDAFEGEFIHE
jgi:uncharacterized repeat protein (TIGR04138 family)